jgi:hypothetical protein
MTASNAPNVTMLTGMALTTVNHYRRKASRKVMTCLIKVGDNPAQKTLGPSLFQLEIMVSMVIPIPKLCFELLIEVPCILVFTTSNGKVVIHPAIPAKAPANKRAGTGTVWKSESIVSMRSEAE